jgi:hypothetical protein
MKKNTFKFVGIIALAALIGFSMVSCDIVEPVGTVRVLNKSSWYELDKIFKDPGEEIEDAMVRVELLRGTKAIRSAQVAYDEWAVFSDAPTGVALGIRVTGTAKNTDGSFIVNELSPLSPSFILGSGKTRSFKYDGLMWLTENK